MVPFSFAGETFYPSAEGALAWPARQALLVADLHLEKASWFARLGQFLPPYDSHSTLTALARVGGEGRMRIVGRKDLTEPCEPARFLMVQVGDQQSLPGRPGERALCA
ncbi:MAG TPA: phosphoesterase, partial [Sphingomicrobium sp.]|nr:phosphoesterase [Sphingomicrobium sp.]